MGRLSIANLPSLSPDYVCLNSQWPDWTSGLETVEAASQEDLLRARRIRASAGRATIAENERLAINLAQKLESYQSEGWLQPSTASSVYMRDRRLAVVSALLARIEQHRPGCGPDDWLSATVMREDWELTPAQFSLRTARSFVETLRGDLNRSGAVGTCGILFAGLHGEYQPQSGRIRVHFHLALTRSFEQAVRALKQLPAYYPIFRNLHGHNRRTPSVRIRAIAAEKLPSALSYTFQSFWPSRWEIILNERWIRQKGRSRIEEPLHTQILLWIDQWRVNEIALLMGARVTPRGIDIWPRSAA